MRCKTVILQFFISLFCSWLLASYCHHEGLSGTTQTNHRETMLLYRVFSLYWCSSLLIIIVDYYYLFESIFMFLFLVYVTCVYVATALWQRNSWTQTSMVPWSMEFQEARTFHIHISSTKQTKLSWTQHPLCSLPKVLQQLNRSKENQRTWSISKAKSRPERAFPPLLWLISLMASVVGGRERRHRGRVAISSLTFLLNHTAPGTAQCPCVGAARLQMPALISATPPERGGEYVCVCLCVCV